MTQIHHGDRYAGRRWHRKRGGRVREKLEIPDREENPVKKILTWGGIALLVYLVVQDPESATRLISGTVDLFGRLADGAMSVVNGV